MATWEQNKDFIVSQVQTGKATPGQIDWYNKWVASGSPESQTGMVAGVQTGPGIGFGDSYVSPGPNTGMLTNNTTGASSGAGDATDGATQNPQDVAMDQNFLNFLSQLGLANLLASFGQDSTAPTAPGFQPQGTPYMGAPKSLVPQGGLMTTVPFGVAPVRMGYIPPKVIDSSSVAADTGLLQYLLKG